MGLSFSTNLSEILTDVSSNISSTTEVNQTADQSCDAFQSLSGCTIVGTGDLNITSGCTMMNEVSQIGSVSNQVNLATDVATSLMQSATSETGFLGVGLASAYNSSVTSSAISTTVTTSSITNMEEINSASSDQEITDCTFVMDGDINISNLSSLSLTGSQVGTSTSYDDIATSVDTTVEQSASATVEGFNMLFLLIILVAAIALVILKFIPKSSGSSSSSKSSLKGGYIDLRLVWNTIGSLIIAGACVGIGINSKVNRTACNNNSQCTSNDWWDTSYGCSCVDHFSCGIQIDNHTPLSNVQIPLLMYAPLENDTTNQDASYLRIQAVRAICGFSATSSLANNAGYNIQNYLKQRKTVLNSDTQLIKKLYDALYDFIKLHMTVVGSERDLDDDYLCFIDPAFQGTDPAAYEPPCSQEIADYMLPLVPYYMSESDVLLYAINTVASSDGASCPSSSSLLVKNIKHM